jgi:hypothetical protein
VVSGTVATEGDDDEAKWAAVEEVTRQQDFNFGLNFQDFVRHKVHACSKITCDFCHVCEVRKWLVKLLNG